VAAAASVFSGFPAAAAAALFCGGGGFLPETDGYLDIQSTIVFLNPLFSVLKCDAQCYAFKTISRRKVRRKPAKPAVLTVLPLCC
jgi:hypothetical protein